VKTQVDRDLTTVSRVDRRLGLIKNLGRWPSGGPSTRPRWWIGDVPSGRRPHHHFSLAWAPLSVPSGLANLVLEGNAFLLCYEDEVAMMVAVVVPAWWIRHALASFIFFYIFEKCLLCASLVTHGKVVHSRRQCRLPSCVGSASCFFCRAPVPTHDK
jgi:hypothetical protein